MEVDAVAPVHKDIQDQLLNSKVSRREPGTLVYPLRYTAALLNYDNWDRMFMAKCCRNGLTMHQFSSDNPPKHVLDLGTGGGLWCIDAAKQWQSSTIVGFDRLELRALQPRLRNIPDYSSIASRVSFVHGDLLDGLPFQSDEFDFVRISGIGLGVPEDEWQSVLEEVGRILKPGGVFEIIEEDLVFPCEKPKARPPPLQIDFPISDSLPSSHSGRSSNNGVSDAWESPVPWEEQSPEFHRRSEHTSSFIQSPASHNPQYSLNVTPPRSVDMLSNQHVRAYSVDRQDHSRLNAAWDAMLGTRFIAPKVLSVLPFYLSSIFTDIHSHSPMEIPLPPNSCNADADANASTVSLYGDQAFDPHTAFDLKPTKGRNSNEKQAKASSPTPRSSADGFLSLWAPMHLARSVQTIVGCKEAIWTEYEKLYGNDPNVLPVVLARTTRTKDGRMYSAKASYREDFDRAWSNWMNDMMDRINMRSYLISQTSWQEPFGELPDWRVWRDTVQGKPEAKREGDGNQPESAGACRTLRGYVCWKKS